MGSINDDLGPLPTVFKGRRTYSSFAFRQRLNGVQRLGIWHTLAFRASRLNYRALVSTVINVH